MAVSLPDHLLALTLEHSVAATDKCPVGPECPTRWATVTGGRNAALNRLALVCRRWHAIMTDVELLDFSAPLMRCITIEEGATTRDAKPWWAVVEFESTVIRDDDVIRMAERCPGLTEVNIAWCVKLTDASIISMAEHCPRLSNVIATGCRTAGKLTHKGIRKVQQLLPECKVTNYGSKYGFPREGTCGFSAADCDELFLQGVKPWDDDAHTVLAAINRDVIGASRMQVAA